MREPLATRVERERAKPIDALDVVDDEFMTNAQIAAKFAISVDTVSKAQDSGELAYVVFGNRVSRHPRRSSPKRVVLAWAASRLVRREIAS